MKKYYMPERDSHKAGLRLECRQGSRERSVLFLLVWAGHRQIQQLTTRRGRPTLGRCMIPEIQHHRLLGIAP